jgi:predicted TIM-barrel fold metal-dependent hydrolase
MNIDDFVAIDTHTHAWKSALRVGDQPTESQQAMGNYFRYTPQHQTVPEMADMYRKQYANTLLKDRILFDSDYPVIAPERWLAEFDKLPIKPDVRPLILKRNAARLLGLGA